MPKAWVTHVKQFAADNNLSYGCALSKSECKDSYKKTTKTKETKTKKDIKPVESKPYTKYDKPIGPTKPKETKPYTMIKSQLDQLNQVPKPEK